jgi:hypothetical protein
MSKYYVLNKTKWNRYERIESKTQRRDAIIQVLFDLDAERPAHNIARRLLSLQ